jgi:hypothetical protein
MRRLERELLEDLDHRASPPAVTRFLLPAARIIIKY